MRETSLENAQAISVVTVVGDNRATAQRTLNHVAKQTIREKIELIVVDVAPAEVAALDVDGMAGAYIRRPETRTWASAKVAGVSAATCPVVAFIEDHCRPAPRWAEKVLGAFKGPWTAVGYAFVNGSPDCYQSRAALMADYAPWVHPAQGGEQRYMPGNNMAYRRDFLLSLEPDLERALGVDFNVQEVLLKRGGKMCIESEAIAMHQCYRSLSELLAANFTYVRYLAGMRVKRNGWGLPMRLLAGLAAPFLVPPLRLWRLLVSYRERRTLWGKLAEGLPVVVLTYCVCAIGESTGYLMGAGNADERLLYYELNCIRA